MTSRTALLQVALNGQRDEPFVPRTPADLAAAGCDAVAAGARVIHLHPCDADGVPTLEAAATAAALVAVRTACPGVRLSLTTWALIDPDTAHRRAQVAAWTVLPDLVTANQGDKGIDELCHDLLSRGVGIEAGLLDLADALRFVTTVLHRTARGYSSSRSMRTSRPPSPTGRRWKRSSPRPASPSPRFTMARASPPGQ